MSDQVSQLLIYNRFLYTVADSGRTKTTYEYNVPIVICPLLGANSCKIYNVFVSNMALASTMDLGLTSTGDCNLR